MAPSTRKVAAKMESAVRAQVRLPGVTFLDVSIMQSFNRRLPDDCRLWASGTPVPLEWMPFAGLMRRKLGSKLVRI